MHPGLSANSFWKNPSAQPFEGQIVGITLRTNPSFNRGEHSANWRQEQTSTPECNDWLAAQLRPHSAKAISERTGQGQRAAEAVKMGRNGLTMAHLVNICRADPAFRASFFQFCGGKLEGDPEMVAALSRAINAVVQGRGE
jgi:hypothetical protein